MISIPAMLKCTLLGDGSNLTPMKMLLQSTRKQGGWISEMAKQTLTDKDQG